MCMSSPKKPDTSAAERRAEESRRQQEEANRRAEQARREAERREQERQRRIAEGEQAIEAAFAPFNDEFYGAREQDYMGFAMPQFDRQFEKAREDLTFALHRAGLGQSGSRAERFGSLQEQADLRRQEIAGRAKSRANSLRGDIENARGSLVTQNQAIANPGEITSMARARVAPFSDIGAYQDSFEPLGPLFQNVTAGIATGLDADRRRRELRLLEEAFPTVGTGSARIVT